MSATALLRTAYFLAKNNIPNSKFSSILEYAHLQGANLNILKSTCSDSAMKYKYSHHESVLEMHEVLSKCISSSIQSLIDSAAYIGIITDESTDVAVDKKIIFYFRIVDLYC